jgi:hypothetical protein
MPAAEPEPEPEPVAAAPLEPPPPAAVTEISFRNRMAVRVGFTVAGLGMVLTNLVASFLAAPLQLLGFLGLAGASGACAVWLYSRFTGQKLSIRGGARLGWITGVFSFVITTVITTVTIAIVGLDKLRELQQASMANANLPTAALERELSNSTVMAALVLVLAVLFATYTVAASLGGAFGAKLLDKRGSV